MLASFRPTFLSVVFVLGLAFAGCDSSGTGGSDPNGDGSDGDDPVAGLCADLDANDDDLVTEEEFVAGFFDLFDTDDDGLLSEGEFASVDDYSTVFPDWQNLFSTFDTDSNGSVSEAEFENAFYEFGLGGTATFSIIDADASGTLDADECGFFGA